MKLSIKSALFMAAFAVSQCDAMYPNQREQAFLNWEPQGYAFCGLGFGGIVDRALDPVLSPLIKARGDVLSPWLNSLSLARLCSWLACGFFPAFLPLVSEKSQKYVWTGLFASALVGAACGAAFRHANGPRYL